MEDEGAVVDAVVTCTYEIRDENHRWKSHTCGKTFVPLPGACYWVRYGGADYICEEHLCFCCYPEDHMHYSSAQDYCEGCQKYCCAHCAHGCLCSELGGGPIVDDPMINDAITQPVPNYALIVKNNPRHAVYVPEEHVTKEIVEAGIHADPGGDLYFDIKVPDALRDETFDLWLQVLDETRAKKQSTPPLVA